MFRVRNTILSEEIATAKFACDLSRCKGACCVVGNAGAPIDRSERFILNKAYRTLKDELAEAAVRTVEADGLIKGNSEDGFELNCVNNEECVFVKYDEHGVAKCAIQQAFYEGRFNWEKPQSCHLFPIRLKQVGEIEYANFEYIPSLCNAGCKRGQDEGIWLSEFLKKPLTRRYDEEWYAEFTEACRQIRVNNEIMEAC